MHQLFWVHSTPACLQVLPGQAKTCISTREKNSGLCLATFVHFITGREKYKYVRELRNSRATSDSSPTAGQVLLPAFECIAAQLDSAPATSGEKSEVLAFDLKLPFILPAKTPESRGESKWTFAFVKSLATSMTLWDTWQQIDTRRKKPARTGLQEQTEQWQWLSYYSHLSMKPLSRARSPWWSMSLPFENASPQDQIVSRISDNTTKTSARALRTHHTNTYLPACFHCLFILQTFAIEVLSKSSWVGCFASWLTIGIDGKASQGTASISFSFFDDQISLAGAVCKR